MGGAPASKATYLMAITFDPAKSERNIAERGLSFERVADMDWHTALLAEDTRHDYGETRIRVFALLYGRLHIAVVSPRGEDLRVISLRKASRKERMLYESERA
jgi:uncharacterized protein